MYTFYLLLFFKKKRKDRRSKIAKTENGHSPVKDGKPPSAAAAALERSGSARNSPLTIALYSSMAKWVCTL